MAEVATLWIGELNLRRASRSPKVGNPIASILKRNVKGIPALFGLNPVSNFMGFTVGRGAGGFRVFVFREGLEASSSKLRVGGRPYRAYSYRA